MSSIKLFAVAAFALLICSCGGDNEVATSVKPIDLTGFKVTDLSDGYQLVVREDINGKTIEEGVLRNGMRNGTWVVYQDKRPLPKSVSNFIDDKYAGVHMEYSTTGQLELVCNYKNDVLHGKFIRIKNTRLLEAGHYVDGSIDGVYTKYYPNNEAKQQEVSYKMGELHGPSNYYNEGGDLIMKYEYKDGEKLSGEVVTPPSDSTKVEN